jgi:hypothetical protein
MQKINCCGMVHHNRQGMPADFGLKTLKLKEGDIIRKVKGGTSAVCWKDKREDHLLNNMLNPPASGHFEDKEGNASKHLFTESYNKGYWFLWVSLIRWHIAAAFPIRRGNGLKKLIFHLLDLTILNTFIRHITCGGKHTSIVPKTTSNHDRSPTREVCHFRLDFKDSNYWPAKSRS